MEKEKPDKIVDTSGQCCPVPMLDCHRAIKTLHTGQVLELISTDVGSRMDIPAWCNRTGHELLRMEEDGKTFRFYVQKHD